MREARLARPEVRAAADDRGGGGAVVRRAERRPRDERCVAVHETGDRVDPRHLERGVGVERRQDPRQAARKHRLPRAGRAAEEDVVPARGGQLERAPGAFLPADVREVGRRAGAVAVRRKRRLGLQLELAAQVGGRLGEVPDRDRGDARESGLAGGVGRTEETLEHRAAARPPRRRGRRRRGAGGRRARARPPRRCARARSVEAAATPRATPARSAGRSRSPPCAARRARD